MKKLAFILLALMLALLVATPVLAAGLYRSEITVRDTSGSSRSGVPVLVDIGISQAVDLGYLGADGLDSRLLEGTQERYYMVASDRVGFLIPNLLASQERGYYFETAWDPPNTEFGVITGADGYITIPSEISDDMQLVDDFEIEFDGYVDTSSGEDKNLVYKEDAFVLFVSDDEEITAQVPYQGGFPTVSATNSNTVDVVGTSHIVNLPPGIVSGKLLLVVFSCGHDETLTWPDGWTELYHDSSATSCTSGAAYKIADGSEGGTITVTISSSECSASASYLIDNYSGIPECGVTVNSGGAAVSPDPPSLSPSWGEQDTLWLAVGGYAAAASKTITNYPANYTLNQLAPLSTGTYFPGIGLAGRNYNIDSENPNAFTLSSNAYWVANTIAIAPSSLEVTATGISSGVHTVKAYADGTNLGIIVDEGEAGEVSDTTLLGGASVPDNANDIIINQNNAMPYFDYLSWTVSDVLISRYQPVSIIESAGATATLINEENPGTFDGEITWGSNDNLDVAVGGLKSISSYTPGEAEGGEAPEVLPLPEGPGLVEEAGPFDLPWLPPSLITPAATGLGWGDGTLISVLLIFAAMGIGVGVAIATGSALLAAIAVGVGLAVGASTGVMGWWVVLVFSIFGGAYIVVARSM